MTITFNGGIHEVILLKDGKQYDVSNYPILFNSISSVSVDFGNQLLGSIEVQITPSFEDGFKILESGLLGTGLSDIGQKPETTDSAASSKSQTSKPIESTVSSPKAGESDSESSSVVPIIAVRFLYPDQFDNDGTEATTPWFSGIVNAPSVSITGSEISITMHANSGGVYAAKLITTVSFQNKSIYECIEQLVKPYEMKISFDEDDSQTESLIKNSKYTGIVSEPPMTTIKNILLAVDCSFTLTNGDDKQPENQIRIKSRKAINEGDIDFTFVMFKQINPAENVIPIYDFQMQSNGALFLKGSVFGSSQSGVDALTKKDVKFEVTSTNNKTKALTSSKAGMNELPKKSATAYGIPNGIATVPTNMTVSGDSTGVNQRGTDSNMGEIESKSLGDGSLGLTFNLTVPGLPRLRAMRLAQVLIGDNVKGLSGVGQIYRVKHRTGSDGWVSEFEFKRQPGLTDGAKLDARQIEKITNTSTAGVSRTPEVLA